jgi:hypothetical protein
MLWKLPGYPRSPSWLNRRNPWSTTFHQLTPENTPVLLIDFLFIIHLYAQFTLGVPNVMIRVFLYQLHLVRKIQRAPHHQHITNLVANWDPLAIVQALFDWKLGWRPDVAYAVGLNLAPLEGELVWVDVIQMADAGKLAARSVEI